ncbi:hypothetical protein Tco_1329548 [Tanacetum coccineum]
MTEPTMEEYMTKTQEDYGSGIARPRFDKDDKFELKGQFLKELRDNTFSGSENKDAHEHIERVLEIVDLFTTPDGKFLSKYCPPSRTAKRMEEIKNFQQEPDETLYRAWERFKELLLRCPQHYVTSMQEVILFYKGLDVPTRQILDSKGERGFGSLPSSTKTNPRDHFKSILNADEANIPSIRRIEPTRYVVSNQQKDNKLQSIKLSRARVPFSGRLKEYDEEEVLKGLKKLQVNLAKFATSLKRSIKEKTRIKEEIKETMNEHYSAIIKDDLPPKEKDP